MDNRLILKLTNHNVYYIKTDKVNYYITIPKEFKDTNICIELKNKMNNYNLEMNDEVWVMENIKNTYSYVDNYNITLVIPVLNDEDVSILEKMDVDNFEIIDKILGFVINDSYNHLVNENIKIDNQVILLNNDRYKTFINWFTSRYQNRVICKNLLEIIRIFNVNATSYKRLEAPGMTFVVGSYNQEVNAPKIEKKEDIKQPISKPVPQVSSGFTSYWLLAVITIAVSIIIAVIAFRYS